MTIAYKIKDLKVIKVECPEGIDWPKLDSDGDTIFINSHFATKEEAYAAAIKNCDCGISLAASFIEG